jgi:hypothetical protein
LDRRKPEALAFPLAGFLIFKSDVVEFMIERLRIRG